MIMEHLRGFHPAFLLALLTFSASAVSAATDKQIYASSCVACHATGVLGAPKLGVQADWAARSMKGLDVLAGNAIKGINSMPPKGGNPALSDDDIRSVVVFMLDKLEGSVAPVEATENAEVPSQKPPVAAADSSKQHAAKPKSSSKKFAKSRTKPVNAFNRLMKPPSQRNLPPMRDGIHDATNDGTAALQHPKEAFGPMPKSNSGNRVDWVAALNRGDLNPRFDLEDENRKPVVLDLNIVREVKGSMPDVVYPHKQHTEWLDCSNCHPAIFVPKKGANNISMASILLGEQCGVCHGKVAFPVSECRKCHSKNKPKTAKK